MYIQSLTSCASYIGTSVEFSEYVVAAIVAHSWRLLDIMPTLEYGWVMMFRYVFSMDRHRVICLLKSLYVVQLNDPPSDFVVGDGAEDVVLLL